MTKKKSKALLSLTQYLQNRSDMKLAKTNLRHQKRVETEQNKYKKLKSVMDEILGTEMHVHGAECAHAHEETLEVSEHDIKTSL